MGVPLKNKFIFPVVLMLPVIFVQVLLTPLISLDTVMPDVILLTVVYYAVINGQLFGTLYGALFGFVFDLVSGNVLGSAMFAKTISGFVAGYFHNENKIPVYFSSIGFPAIVLLIALIDAILVTLIANFDINANIVSLLFRAGLLPAVYTSFFSVGALFIPSNKRPV